MRARPKKSLSQNFLVDPNLRRRIVDELDAAPEEAVLEIGAGHGELSALLAGTVGELVLLEKDDNLAVGLERSFATREDVRVVHGDALEIRLDKLVSAGRTYRVLSNLPYSISTPLLFLILDMRPAPERIVVTVQREVAERIVAAPGTGAYGALSVGVQVRAAPRIALRIGRRAFRPVPAVESAVVVIQPDPNPPTAEEEAALRQLTRAAFGQRRKQMQKILRTAPEYRLTPEEVEELAASLGFAPSDRPEALRPTTYRALAVDLSLRVEKRRART